MRGLSVLAAVIALMMRPADAAENAPLPVSEPEPVTAVDEEPAVPLDADLEDLDLSVEPEQIQVEPVVLPSCDDEKLRIAVLDKIDEYHRQHPVTGILEKRRQALLRKNLRTFSEVKADGFTSKDNYNVANRLLMTKINMGLDSSQLRLCRNTGVGRAGEIYLLIYPMATEINISLLNFIQAADNENELFINYPQNDEPQS